MIRTILGVFFLCVAPLVTAGERDNLFNSAVRIQQGNASGSGVIVEDDGEFIVIMTAAHVVDQGRAAQVQFYCAGRESNPAPAEVIAVAGNGIDLAAIRVKKTGELDYVSVVPCNPGYQVRAGEPIMTVGCAEGRWATAFRGHVVGVDNQTIYTAPAFASGRSGSGLLNDNGELIGIVSFRTEKEGGNGGSVPIALLSGVRTNAAQAPIPQALLTEAVGVFGFGNQSGGSCGPQGCPPQQGGGYFQQPQPMQPYAAPQQSGQGFGLFPNLNLPRQDEREERRDERKEDVVPVAPEVPVPAPAAAFDTSKIEEALEAQGETMLDLRQATQDLKASTDKVGDAVGDLVGIMQEEQAAKKTAELKAKTDATIAAAADGFQADGVRGAAAAITDPDIAEPWVTFILAIVGGTLGLGIVGRTAVNLIGPRVIMWGLGKVHAALVGEKETSADAVVEEIKSRLKAK